MTRLNALAPEQAEAALLACCGSRAWARAMAKARPFPNKVALLATADSVWNGLQKDDWLEAFAAHPRIGDKAAFRRKVAAAEQAGAVRASEETLEALAQGNREYEERFGRIFIVCASGKSADQMLALLKDRLKNSPALELRVAAAEQAKITRLRLEKLL